MTLASIPCTSAQTPLSIPTTREFPDGLPEHASLIRFIDEAWHIGTGRGTRITVRPAHPRDLPAVAALLSRCEARSLMNTFHLGGKRSSIHAVEQFLRSRLTVIAIADFGDVLAIGGAAADRTHSSVSAQATLLVDDGWKRRGIGSELLRHLAGAAVICGYHQLTVYPGTEVESGVALSRRIGAVQRMSGRRTEHLHVFLPTSAVLGLGPLRHGTVN
jgi:N-acetylglutamate synthase-like GNAT family acetyltransferase